MHNYMVNKAALFLALLLFCGQAARAQEGSVSATLDHDELEVGEEAYLTVSINYAGSGRAQEPHIAENSHLTITPMGTSTSISIINGRQSKTYEYRYAIAADAAGNYTLDGITAVVDREVLRAAPLRFKVVGQREENRESAMNNGLSLEASIDRAEVYVGEQIIYRVRFLRKTQIAEASYDPPPLGDFISEQLGDQRNYETVVGGQRVAVTEIKTALFPTKPGTYTIEPARIKASVLVRGQGRRGGFFDDFFMNAQTKAVNIASKPLEVVVKPLPTEGRPAGFANLVGTFEMKYNISKKRIKAKESTTLTVAIEGFGNVANLAAPTLAADLPYKIYEDKPFFEKKAQDGGLYGRYIAKWALVPGAAGEYQIPEVKVPYFDTETHSYRVLHTPPVTFTALKADEEEDLHLTATAAPGAAAPQRQQVALLGEDVMPICQDAAKIGQGQVGKKDAFWFWPLLILPPAAWGVFSWRRRRADRSPAELARRRAGKAYKELERTLPAATASWEELAAALRSYYAAKLMMGGRSITPGEIKALLEEKKVAASLAERAAGLLSQAEKAVYMGDIGKERAEFAQELLLAMKEVDNALS